MNDDQVRKERRSSGKITSKQLRERTKENARSKSPILAEKKTISDSSDENAAKNAERQNSKKRKQNQLKNKLP